MKQINRRESPRMAIHLRCYVTSPALWIRSAMYTENISRNGMLVAWRGESAALPAPALGQIITIDVELPANHGFEQKCIHVQGQVTRVVESLQGFPHVAMRVNYMDFRSFHDQMQLAEATAPASQPWMA